MFPVDIAKFLKTAFFMEHLRWLLLATYHNTIKSAGLLFLWFCASMCFHFDQKLTQNVAQIILYHCMTWQFLPFLNWFITCFQFQDIFWKNISCFWFWWKTYTKRCSNNHVILCVKRLSSPALCGWSSAFNFSIKWENAA